jgi:signal peptidase I
LVIAKPYFQKINHHSVYNDHMKQPQRRPSIFVNFILFIGMIIIWIAFAPAKIGGQTSYVMVNGISMEPNYHTGDLVIVRKAQTYQIGDVVTYHDPEMGAYVIHRIIGVEQGQFIIKGDNNSWVDAYQPTPDEIIGKQWVYAPKAGKAMLWLRKPINLSLTILLLGGILMTSMISKPPKGKKGKNSPSVKLSGTFEGALYLLGFLFLGFLGLSIFAFTRPATRTAGTIPYQQDGVYSYTATGTPGVYDTEMVRSGEPVFPRLACFLNIGLAYNLSGNQLQNISGNRQMFARVMDEPSGWQRTVPLLSQTAFSGNSNFSMATLDLCQLETLVNLVEKETGLHTNTYTVEIVTNIVFTANTSGGIVTGTFDPTLAFKYDKVHLYLANTNTEIDPLHIMKKDVAGSSNVEANTLSLLGWKLTVGFVRMFALLGSGISLSGLLIMGLSIFNTARQSEDALIGLRYSSMIVDVYEKSLEPTSTTIDVTSMENLAKLAERQGTMILHMRRNFLHYYLVQNNGTTYRYVTSAGRKDIVESDSSSDEMPKAVANKHPVAEPARVKAQRRWMRVSRKNNSRPRPIQNEIPESIVSHQKNNIIQKDWLVAEEEPEYIIRTGEIEFVMTEPETEMMRKVRL